MSKIDAYKERPCRRGPMAEHKAPEYQKMNPRGRVPTLKDGDFVLYESLAILAYLDRKHPEPCSLVARRRKAASFGGTCPSSSRICALP